MKHLKVMILLFLAGLPLSLMAQVSEINGVVKDGAGEPLIGVSVIVKGSKVGTATDVDGHFSLKADKDKCIHFGHSTIYILHDKRCAGFYCYLFSGSHGRRADSRIYFG